MFLQKEFALLFRNADLHALADLGLQPRHFELVLDEQQDLFHAPQEGHRLQHFLQLFAVSAGHGRGKVSQRRGLVGRETVEERPQTFFVEWVKRQQLLNLIDDGQTVGAYFFALVVLWSRVIHLGNKRAVLAHPAHHAQTLNTLGDELNTPAVTHRVVHPGNSAKACKIFWPGRGLIFRVARINQANQLVRCITNALDSFPPQLIFQHNRRRLPREKRSHPQRQYQQFIGQNFVETRRHTGQRYFRRLVQRTGGNFFVHDGHRAMVRARQPGFMLPRMS